VNHIKAAIRKLVGRKKSKPLTLDTVSVTPDGFCLIGWYFEGQVSKIDIQTLSNETVQFEQTSISRPDVKAATGKPAIGFQILITSDRTLDDLKLSTTLDNNKTLEYGLTLKGESVAIETKPVVSTSTGGLEGFCEFSIVGERTIFIGGWILSPLKNALITLKQGKQVIGQASGITRFKREDVMNAYSSDSNAKNAGYMLFVDYDSNVDVNEPFTLHLEIDDQSTSIKVDYNVKANVERMTNAKRLLNNWFPHAAGHFNYADKFQDMLGQIYKSDMLPTARRIDYGKLPESPKASLIIPLYGRYDFMRYQIAHFNTDPSLHNCEIIYVVDDPSIASQCQKLAAELEIIFDISFTLLILSRNVGFGPANNIAARRAASNVLFLVNSDVLPKSSNWLDAMIETVSGEAVGVVGARLLFEDNSIQHDGMAPMTIKEYPGLVFNDHPFKGWPIKLSPNSAEVAECQMVTAALVAIKKSDYDTLKGFDPMYILGDFEDSDMCLRLEKLGKKNVIRRDVEMYHLERQSQNLVPAGRWKHNITILNAVVFNQRWKEQLMPQLESGE
jgi:GT2 family glycosyltransferase